MIRNKNAISNKLGFTIVELLVVIVVIGILAAITIISYSGIANKAIVASLQSDLDNNSKQLKLYNVEYGYYPNTLDGNKCPNAPTTDTRYCLKSSTDTTLAYAGGGQVFTLTASKNSITYEITESLSPYSVTVTPITAIAAITGTLQISQTLTAGAITPAAATVTYQWQSAATSGGTYTNIPGATASTYVLNPSNTSKYLKVVITGSGGYSGTITSAPTSSAIAVDANWLTVGTQTWAKYNLDVGTMIVGTTAQTNNSTLEKYCYAGNAANCTTYGGLYQWSEAMQYATTEGAQGICPAGSHIPTDSEWTTLDSYLGSSTAGTQLKSGGSSGLNMPLPGYRNTDGSFLTLSTTAHMWASSESSATVGWDRYLGSSYNNMIRDTSDKSLGFSVRCLAN